jgi:hypothetical protein
MAENIPCDCGHSCEAPVDCTDCNRRFCPECYEQHNAHIAVDKDGKPIKAQLFETLSWFCPSCGHQNSIKLNRQDPKDGDLDLTDDEAAKLRQHLGLEEWESLPSPDELGGALIQIPYNVTCLHCKLVFSTVMPPALSDDLDLSPDEEDEDDIDDDDFSPYDPEDGFGG